MTELRFNTKTGFGKTRVGEIEYFIMKTADGYSFGCKDYSDCVMISYWIVENKKRMSTIRKYAEQYGIEIIEVAQT